MNLLHMYGCNNDDQFFKILSKFDSIFFVGEWEIMEAIIKDIVIIIFGCMLKVHSFLWKNSFKHDFPIKSAWIYKYDSPHSERNIEAPISTLNILMIMHWWSQRNIINYKYRRTRVSNIIEHYEENLFGHP